MSARIGIGIAQGEVRAVVVRDGHMVWRGVRPVDSTGELGQEIVALLRSAPASLIARGRVVAALGPGFAQVKRLLGLPVVSQGEVVTQSVRANVGRFFLRNGVELSVPDAHRNNHVWWGAAIDAPAVAALEQACTQLRLRFDGCIPTAAALACVVRDGSVGWKDGSDSLTVTVRAGDWIEIRRGDGGTPAAEAIPALASLDADAQAIADAVLAAWCPAGAPLLLRRPSVGPGRRAAARVALAAFATLMALSAVFAPGLAASVQLARDAPRLNALRDSVVGLAPAMRELNAATAGLSEIEEFAARRTSMVMFIGAVASALPDSSAVVSFRTDSAGGSMTLLSTAAARVIPALAEVEQIVDPKVTGAVTREAAGTAQVQRLTLRFHLRRGAAAPAR